jgi:hypothetical protein
MSVRYARRWMPEALTIRRQLRQNLKNLQAGAIIFYSVLSGKRATNLMTRCTPAAWRRLRAPCFLWSKKIHLVGVFLPGLQNTTRCPRLRSGRKYAENIDSVCEVLWNFTGRVNPNCTLIPSEHPRFLLVINKLSKIVPLEWRHRKLWIHFRLLQ